MYQRIYDLIICIHFCLLRHFCNEFLSGRLIASMSLARYLRKLDEYQAVRQPASALAFYDFASQPSGGRFFTAERALCENGP